MREDEAQDGGGSNQLRPGIDLPITQSVPTRRIGMLAAFLMSASF